MEAGPTYYWRASSNGAIWTSPLAFTVVLDIHPYPNPFRASEGHNQVIFTNLVGESDIKITTLSGDLIYEQANIGPDEWSWNVKNSKGEDLAPGIYLYVIDFPAGSTNGKLMVIR